MLPCKRLVRVAVAGCHGRMGRELVTAILASSDLSLAAASVRPGSPLAGRTVGEVIAGSQSDVLVTDRPGDLVDGVDVVVDFTSPEAACRHVAAASDRGIPVLVGVTGFTAQQREMLRAGAEKAAILLAPNTSLGVAILGRLAQLAAAALGEQWDVGILDVHHREKQDAPSGTAKALVAAIKCGFAARQARSAAERSGAAPAIEVVSIRAGTVAGDHTIHFAGKAERIELSHRAGDRSVYAIGALNAARWLDGRSPGFYTMADVIA